MACCLMNLEMCLWNFDREILAWNLELHILGELSHSLPELAKELTGDIVCDPDV